MKTFFKALGFLTWAAGLVVGLVMEAILPVWCAAIISGSVLFAIGKLLENQEEMLANQKQILAAMKDTPGKQAHTKDVSVDAALKEIIREIETLIGQCVVSAEQPKYVDGPDEVVTIDGKMVDSQKFVNCFKNDIFPKYSLQKMGDVQFYFTENKIQADYAPLVVRACRESWGAYSGRNGKEGGFETEQDSAEKADNKSTADAGIAGGKVCPVCGERQRPDRETCIACGAPLY